MLLEAFKHSRVGYHLACAFAAAFEEGDPRADQIKALMTEQELAKARATK